MAPILHIQCYCVSIILADLCSYSPFPAKFSRAAVSAVFFFMGAEIKLVSQKSGKIYVHRGGGHFVGRPKKPRLEKFTSRPFLCMPFYYQLKTIEKITQRQHMI